MQMGMGSLSHVQAGRGRALDLLIERAVGRRRKPARHGVLRRMRPLGASSGVCYSVVWPSCPRQDMDCLAAASEVVL
jgi:hypothetical protein